jgi:hypothetical protein
VYEDTNPYAQSKIYHFNELPEGDEGRAQREARERSERRKVFECFVVFDKFKHCHSYDFFCAGYGAEGSSARTRVVLAFRSTRSVTGCILNVCHIILCINHAL